MTSTPYVSVLVPAKNEADNLPNLLSEIAAALRDFDYEIVVVDDGSTDDTVARLRKQKAETKIPLRILRHEKSLGQSTALHRAAQAARGTWLVTIDGDGQNDPADIP